MSFAASTLVFVTDVDASIAFYVDRLGFTLNMRHEEEGRALVAGVSRGERCALLLTNQWPDRIGKGILYAAFDREELDACRVEFAAKQVAFKPGIWGKPLFIIEDPDGNQIFLSD